MCCAVPAPFQVHPFRVLFPAALPTMLARFASRSLSSVCMLLAVCACLGGGLMGRVLCGELACQAVRSVSTTSRFASTLVSAHTAATTTLFVCAWFRFPAPPARRACAGVLPVWSFRPCC